MAATNSRNEEPTSQTTNPEPFFLSLNSSQPTTIILLHGLVSCHLEWALVIPQLSSYHLLVVDLPGHSGSSHVPPPYTIPSMADTVASLIRHHAHNGVAHVVGLSMGGFITLDLARRCPELCLSAFATGAAPFEGIFAWLAARPWVAYSLMWMLDKIPDRWYWWLAERNEMRRHEELKLEMGRNRKWEVIKAVYGSILRDCGWEEMKGVDRVKTLNVAGGLQDDVEAARKVGRVWKETGVEERLGSRAVVVRGAVHAWDLQFPEVFAEGIKSWIEGRELPKEFEELV